MERQRGLVIERSGRKVVALTRTGEFVTFRSSEEGIIPGLEVLLPTQRFATFAWRRLAPALALASVMIVASVFGYQEYLYAKPLMAYVTLDCAGSVELEVNEAGRVKSATAIDEAGGEALAKISYANRPAQEVISALVKLQDTQEGAEVVVAVIPVKPNPGVDTLEKKVIDTLEKTVESEFEEAGVTGKEQSRQVASFRLDPETRESAKSLGISAGRAAFWALKSSGPEEDEPPGHRAEPGKDTTHGKDTQPGQNVGPGKGPAEDERPGKKDELPGEKDEPPGRKDELPGGKAEPPGKKDELPGGKAEPPGKKDELPGGKAEPPGKEVDPGKGSKEQTVLDTIKGALPKIGKEDLEDLNERKDAKEREKYLKEITKEWLRRVAEELRKGNLNPPGNSKPGKGNGSKAGK